MPPKKNTKGKPIGSTGLFLEDLVELAMKDATRPERIEAFVIADSGIDAMISASCAILKEKELAVKVTPFARVHTRYTMAALFNFQFTASDPRLDD
jgi:hypothetical protein